jgi:uncharacterized protein
MKSQSKHFPKLRAWLETVPLVDCHDHSGECGPKFTDPLQPFIDHYFRSDLHSASSDAEMAFIEDAATPLERRWPIFERAWKRARHTGYAMAQRRAMKEFYGIEEFTLDAVKRMWKKPLRLDNAKVFEDLLAEAHIAVRLEDVWPDHRKVLDGTFKLSPRGRLVISLPGFHAVRNQAEIQRAGAAVKKTITCLDEYLAACREIFEGYKRFGAVAFKDQSAYSRALDFGNPTRAEAEQVFNRLLEDPNRSAAYPDGVRPLDDYLFHAFLRMARDLDLPVQIHTGHMAGIRNEIAKTNAVQLTPVFDLHRDVRFDLFHANWPYSGELLFLVKNYPNVTMDFCWANIIDPVYCQRLFQQALSAVPHGKVHAYGSDYCGRADLAWAHAGIARDNVAIALSGLIEMEYLDLDEAKEVAWAWLFGNANEFFRLGLKQRAKP